ncbi:MAG: hypothetical protein J6B77_07815 [Clostridia bacterium]|nr:hypothetical protein [Clostridia bacterium]
MRDAYTEETRSFLRRNPAVASFLKNRRMKFVLKLLLFEAAVFFVAFEIFRYGLPIPAVIVGAVAATVLPFPVLHPLKHIGKGYLGVIVDVKEDFRRSTERASGVVKNLSDAPIRKYVLCRVRCTDGKIRTFRASGVHQSVYRRESRVLCIRGIDHPIPLDPKTHTVCLFCGARILNAVDHCAGCGADRADV